MSYEFVDNESSCSSLHAGEIDISTNDFNYVVFACLDGLAREWWDLVSLEHENINSFREKFIKKY